MQCPLIVRPILFTLVFLTSFATYAEGQGFTEHLDALQTELQARSDALVGDLSKDQKGEKKLWDSALKKLAKPRTSLKQELSTAKKVIAPLIKKKPEDEVLGGLIKLAIENLAREITDLARSMWVPSQRIEKNAKTAKLSKTLGKTDALALTGAEATSKPLFGLKKLKQAEASSRKAQGQLEKLTQKKGTALLLALRPSSGALRPSFHRDTTDYTVELGLDDAMVTLSALTADPDSTLTVGGVTASSGEASAPVAVAVDGVTHVDLLVVSEDGEQQRVYTVGFTREDIPAQRAYLKASNPNINDGFGRIIAADGDTVAVAALREQGVSQGLDGNQEDNSGGIFPEGNAGALYIFRKQDAGWMQAAYVKSSDFNNGDRFAASLDVQADTIIVGAPGKSDDEGGAYVFVREDDTWVEQALIDPPENLPGDDKFGRQVALSGERAVIGSVNKLFFFERVGDMWVDTGERLDPSPSIQLNESGTYIPEIDLSGDTVVIGNQRDRSNATGIDGDEADVSLMSAGAVLVYGREPGGTWVKEAYIKASNTESYDGFGERVRLDGDTLAVGATGEDSSATGVGGDQSDNSASGAGAAYVFTRVGTTWTQQAYIKASNTDADVWFGSSLGLEGDVLVVGAASEDHSDPGIDGDQASGNAVGAGAAYLFRRVGSTWSQGHYVKSAQPLQATAFGAALSLRGGTLAIGAPDEARWVAGIDGEGDFAPWFMDSGAAFVFEVDP